MLTCSPSLVLEFTMLILWLRTSQPFPLPIVWVLFIGFWFYKMHKSSPLEVMAWLDVDEWDNEGILFWFCLFLTSKECFCISFLLPFLNGRLLRWVLFNCVERLLWLLAFLSSFVTLLLEAIESLPSPFCFRRCLTSAFLELCDKLLIELESLFLGLMISRRLCWCSSIWLCSFCFFLRLSGRSL